MSWSWSNPTEDEALEAYQYYKGKYAESASRRSEYRRQERQYISERSSAKSEIRSCKAQKINFEKRISGIEKIIKMLEGNAGWFSADVPGAISKARKTLKNVDQSYQKCIRMTGVHAASFETAFHVSSVEENSHSRCALQEYKTEKQRLQSELSKLKKQIENLSSLISSLNAKITAASNAQSSMTSAMNSYAYDMNHYKKYTY